MSRAAPSPPPELLYSCPASASTVSQERGGREELRRLMTKLGHALDDRDRADSELRRIRDAVERAEGG